MANVVAAAPFGTLAGSGSDQLDCVPGGTVLYRRPEPPWVRRRVCGLGDLPVGSAGSSLSVLLFELNRGQVPDRGVQSVGVVPVSPAGDLPFDVSPVFPGRAGQVDGFG